MPLVSVIIPTYNRQNTLGEAIDSVFSQSYKDVEVIVVDHASTDGTIEWIKKTYPSKIRLITLPFCPLPGCPRNAGLRVASGTYVAFLDSDDIWLPHKLENQIKALEGNPEFGLSYGNAVRFGSNLSTEPLELGFWQMKQGHVFEKLLIENFIPTSSVVVRRTCFDTVGNFDLSPLLRSAEDYELWLRIAHQYAVHAERSVVVRLRVSGHQVTADSAKGYEPQKAVFDSIQKKIPIRNDLFKKALAGLHLRHFRYALMAGSSPSSFHLHEAWKLNPFRPRILFYKLLYTFAGGVTGLSKWISFEKKIKKLTFFI